jgi:hypothetical protein
MVVVANFLALSFLVTDTHIERTFFSFALLPDNFFPHTQEIKSYSPGKL